MKEVYVTWQEQIELMEYAVGASGWDDYHDAREEMHNILRHEHGKFADLELEEIPQHELEKFHAWLNEEEE